MRQEMCSVAKVKDDTGWIIPTSSFSRIPQRMLKTDLLFLNLGPIELYVYLLLKHYKGTHQ